jgi:antitoxin ParD1/3/4
MMGRGGPGEHLAGAGVAISRIFCYQTDTEEAPGAMSKISKISVALTPEMVTLVAQAVESGEYATSSEVIREALREWKQRRSLPPPEREHLQRLWAQGIASGPGRFESMAAIKAEARRRLMEEQPAIDD